MNTKNCDCKDCPDGACSCDCHADGKKDMLKQVSKVLIYVAAVSGIYGLLKMGGLMSVIGFVAGLAFIYRALLWYKKRTGSTSIDETLEKARTEGATMFESAKDKVTTMAHDAKEMASTYSEKAADTYHDVKDTVVEKMDNVKETVEEKMDDVKETASNTHNNFVNKMHEVKNDVKEELAEMLDDAKEFVVGEKKDEDKKDNV